MMAEEDLFSRMGDVYGLLVDEKSRLAREEPFLLEIAEQARRSVPRKGGKKGRIRPRSTTQILDLGCGIGFHSRLFARAGYPVTAIDRSESMLAKARSVATPDGVLYKVGDLMEPLDTERPASLTLLLGNTLSLFQSSADLRRVFHGAADATSPGGLILCQVLNYEHLKKKRAAVATAHGKVDGRETVLTKSLQFVDDGSVLLTFTASQQDPSGKWETYCESSRLAALKPKQIHSAARAAGLQEENCWGDLAGIPFKMQTSSDYVALFRKKH
jgi:SAM-dependent methyltransferase